MVANQRLDAIHIIAKDTYQRAKEAEAKAQAAKEKAASHAIENYKHTKEFKDEVGEAIINAYLKGFV